MAEFKFSCPQCGQHIQCDTGYSGTQINCPTCQQAIVVPQAPRSAAAPPAYVAPPPPPPPPAGSAPSLATRQSTAAPSAGKRFAGAPGLTGAPPPPKKKAGALKIVLSVTAALVGAAIGFFGVQFALHHVGSSKSKGNPAAQVATPTANEAMQALGILGKVYSAYTNTTSATADGMFTLSLDLSNLTMADINPNARATPNASPAARNRRGNMPRNVAITADFSVKRGQSNWYYFAMEPVIKIDRQTISNTTAYWSSDKGIFVFNDTRLMGAPTQRTYMQTADAGSANDAAEQMKMMRHAFDDPTQLTKIIKDLGQSDDEPVNGQDCSTITAKVLGQKVKVWVNKTSYQILQWEITLGGAISDADIDDTFSLIATVMTNVPPERLAQAQMQVQQMELAKTQVKMFTPAVAKIRGTIIAKTRNIELNPTLTADDFNYSVPPGVRLVKLPTMAATQAGSLAARQRNTCINNLRQIDAAKNEFALEKGKKMGDPCTEADIKPYIKLDASGNLPKCPAGGTYTLGKVGENPTCSIAGHVLP